MLPRYGEWDARFRPVGLTVVGVHTPELSEERDPKRVAEFVKAQRIGWPVVIDGDFAIWERFHVQAWPTILLIDRAGTVRGTFVGDDRGDEIEAAIRLLL